MNDISKPVLPSCVINCVVYDKEGKRHDITLDAISDVLAQDDGSFVWVGLYEPADDILEKLQEEFCLHDLAVEDAQNAHQRPKLEAYGNSMFVVTHTAQVVSEKIVYGETHIFVGPRYLITVRHGSSLSYAPVRERVEREPELLVLGPSYGLYAVLDFIVDNAEEAITTAQSMLGGQFGSAGDEVVIEEFLPVEEASFIVMAYGTNILTMET